MDIAALCAAVAIVISRGWTACREAKSLVFLSLVFLGCTLISSNDQILGRNIGAAIRIAVIYIVYACCFYFIASRVDKHAFVRIATGIACAATILLILQYIAPRSMWDGALPLPISSSDQFLSVVNLDMGIIRPHAFFQEASYYALYTTPVLICSVINNKKAISCLLFIGILLSSSLIGYVSVLVVVAIVFLRVSNKGNEIDWRRIALSVSSIFFVLLITFVIIESGAIPFVNDLSQLVSKRVDSVFDIFSTYSWGRSSAQMRLIGNSYLFEQYSLFEKIFGLGVGQYATVFSGVETTYSSSAVNMLLAFGLVGGTALVGWLIYLFVCSSKSAFAYVLILVIAVFTDNVLFGWYFFYLLTWVIVKAEKSLVVRERTEPPIKIPAY